MRDHARRFCRPRSRRRLSDRADRDPDIIVELTHWPIGKSSKAVLELCGAPLLERRMPTRGHQPLRSGYRPRIPAAVWEILAEQAAFVRDHQYVIGRDVLREGRNLLLDLLVPTVRSSASGFVPELALLDDLHAEPLCGAPKCGGEGLVVWLGPMHQEPAPPLLPDQ